MEHKAENYRLTCFIMKTLKEAGQKRHPWADFFKPVSEHEKDRKLIIFPGEMSKKSRFEESRLPRGEITVDSLSIEEIAEPIRMWHQKVECETPWLALLVYRA